MGGRKRKVGGFHTPFAQLAELVPAKPPAGKPAAKPPPAPALAAKPSSDDDLWMEEIAGAAPIGAKGGRVGAPPEKPAGVPRKLRDDSADVLAELADLIDGSGRFDITDGDASIEGVAEGVDRKLLKRLKAGDYPLQGQVDLHGLTREAARTRVHEFVDASRRAGKRCVLVVHGRGLHSPDQLPVLKQALRAWLARGPLARAVLAFATARPQDGGAGAVSLLLRKSA
jgi:DNA-nicking Smr family endonuclease